jgi:hypothetical protein
VNELREGFLVRAGDVIRWSGAGRDTVRKVLRSGAVRQVTLPGARRKHYVREDVLRVFCGETGREKVRARP